ncbi:MAG: hypothetical protein KAS13_08620 [Candidatus Omnitrophica bacterium]|nr:hypothetical protein [Candidatus Omnitrophota bacterium]
MIRYKVIPPLSGGIKFADGLKAYILRERKITVHLREDGNNGKEEK